MLVCGIALMIFLRQTTQRFSMHCTCVPPPPPLPVPSIHTHSLSHNAQTAAMAPVSRLFTCRHGSSKEARASLHLATRDSSGMIGAAGHAGLNTMKMHTHYQSHTRHTLETHYHAQSWMFCLVKVWWYVWVYRLVFTDNPSCSLVSLWLIGMFAFMVWSHDYLNMAIDSTPHVSFSWHKHKSVTAGDLFPLKGGLPKTFGLTPLYRNEILKLGGIRSEKVWKQYVLLEPMPVL